MMTEPLLDRLMTVFTNLHVVIDTSIVCYAAADSFTFDESPELATVILQHIYLRIDEQMKTLSDCIEELGFRTCYSEDSMQDQHEEE
jgi:hypothetical protein